MSPGDAVNDAKTENPENTTQPQSAFKSMATSESNTSYLSKKTFNIPLLKDNGSNYTAWKFCQTTVLRLRGLLTIANGTEKKPEPLTGADALIATFAQIAMNMDNGAMAEVIETLGAHEAWKRVIKQWEGKGMQSLSFLFQQLMSTKIEEEEDLTTAFNNIQSLTSKMKTLGEPISNLMLAQVLMNALPPSYAIISSVVSTSNQGSTVTSDMVIEAAYAEEKRRKAGVGLNAMFTQASKLNSRSKSQSNAKGKGKDKGPPCKNCAKTGHTKKECWGKGGNAEGTGPHQKRRAAKEAKEKALNAAPKSESAKVALTNNGNDSEPTLYALPATNNRSCASSWLLDSGASRHMTPNRHWFATYQSLSTPINIQVGNGNRIPAIGVGRVLVTLKNRQGQETKAYIKSVLHVPDLSASLLLVKELVDGGTDVMFKHGGAILVSNKGQGKEVGYARASGQLY
ncbi:Reverse transcriptase (RNA-dependent DNA polymerase) [Rhizoctonia solani]|uniref:Reverse transcriptase (RNA-dependent DNA polymerase) n=1 Tax=Rhizoctonia solani TaxID=456999 RepID=A0A8H7LQG6_9AGAM|nr:Reverse transcriptase (RNA-dependent DNA polymerase) [Rhizoctonia solani]